MKRFHHIGIACKDIESLIKWIRLTHKILSVTDIIYDPEQEASVCLIKTAGGLEIELISGLKVENIIKKGISYYHLCYEVDNNE